MEKYLESDFSHSNIFGFCIMDSGYFSHTVLNNLHNNFLPVTLNVKEEGRHIISTIDLAVLTSLNGFAWTNVFWSRFTVFCSSYLIILIPVIALAVIWGHHEHDHRQLGYKAFVRAVFAVVIALAIGFLIEGLSGRARPYVSYADVIKVIGNLPGNSSMPSMHTLTAFAFTVALILQKPTRKLGWWLLLLAVLVGLGRMMAGMHYPSDVLMGLLIGVFAAFLLVFEGSPLFRWLSTRRVNPSYAKATDDTAASSEQ